MKKTLLMLMLWPLIGLSQTTLVTWNNTSAPTGNAANVTALAIATGGGVGVSMNPNEAQGLYINELHNAQPSTAINTSKYVEFAVGPVAGYKITPSQFTFTYFSPSDAGAKKMELRGSLDGVSWTSLTNAASQSVFALAQGQEGTITANIPAALAPASSSSSSQKLKIRMYFYDLNNNWYSKVFIRTTGYSTSSGPKFSGTVSVYSSILKAENDTATTNINTAAVINVTGNDAAGAAPINSVSVSAPANGTAVVNADKTVTYTPATGYAGLDTFTYTVQNGVNPASTATVTVTVQGTAPTGMLSGTYYVGSYGHFATITAAVNYLNGKGVSGPVVFLLKDKAYSNTTGESFPVTINQFTGTSATKTVTFKPAPHVNATIEAFRTAEYTAVPAVFKLNGADNIIFDGSNGTDDININLWVINSSFTGPAALPHSNDNSNRAVFWIASVNSANPATNITIKYTQIKQTWKNASYSYSMGVYAGNNLTSGDYADVNMGEATGVNANITITANDFVNVKQGVYINGQSGAPTQNVIVSKNDLGAENNGETIIQPCALTNVNTFEFSENNIYRLYRDTPAGSLVSSGIYVKGNSTHGTIVKNDIRDLTKTLDEGILFGGIVLESSSTSSDIMVANNFIRNVISANAANYRGNGHGIIIASGGGYKLYHNTVVLNTNQSGSAMGYTAALYVESGVGLDVRNNIFANNQTSTNTRRSAVAVRAFYSGMNTIFSFLDYNNYSSADKLVFVANQWSVGDIESFNSPDYLTDMAAWRTLTGKDQHTVVATPVFMSSTDLHLSSAGNAAIDNEGTLLAAVTKDIDGQYRSTTAPSIGADEMGSSLPSNVGASNAGIYCSSSTTWNGTQWSNGQPAADKDVIFTADYTKQGGVLNACSLNVLGTAKVVFTANSNAVVVHSINVAGTASLTFDSSSNLTQIENTQNSGNVTVKRNSSMLKRLDYTMWSSPVTGLQTLLSFSPATQTTRFYTYNTITNIYNSISNPAATTFTKGKGYLIRMPNDASATVPAVYAGEFTGTPNNGEIRIPLSYVSSSQGYNAVGNPYPSPICIIDFLEANSENIEGTIYIWRKTNDHTQSSYWTVNKAGAVANAAPGGTNDLVANPFAINPRGLLNTGQGFIVKAKNSNDLVFKNHMRRAANFSNFFRTSGANDVGMASDIPASHVWVNVTNAEGLFNQTMVAYIDGATTGYDNGYDGFAFVDNAINLYTVVGSSKYAIQSRPEFNAADVVPMGYQAAAAGTYTIAIDHADGVFAEGQNVYLKDNVNGNIQNLNEGSYTFSTEIGTFDARFELIYAADALGTENPVLTPSQVVVYAQGRQVSVKAPQTIKSVAVYDVVGKLIYEKNNISGTEFTTSDLNATQQLLIVRVNFEDNQVLSKNIMLK